MNAFIASIGLMLMGVGTLSAVSVDDAVSTALLSMVAAAGFTITVYSRNLAAWWAEDGGTDALKQ